MYKLDLYRKYGITEIDANMHRVEGGFVSFYKVESGDRHGQEKFIISYNKEEVKYFKKIEDED